MKRMLCFAMSLVVAAGCGGSDDTTDDEATLDAAPPAATTPAPATTQVGDAEIADITVTANMLDAEGGQTAKDKAANAEVKAFAERMVADHTKSNEEAKALAQRLNITPSDNATSQQMKSDHERAKQELSSKTGAEFDRAYIAHEITMHQNVLNALDQTLIPNAQNPELKALLERTRPVIESHLQMAQQIQTKLGTGQQH